MRYGPLIFLAALFALAISWVGFVFAPQMQVGQLQQTNAVPAGALYPVARPGLAREGLEIYRANGCQYCHSQQVSQSGTVFDIALTDAGTNQAALLDALRLIRQGVPGAFPAELTGLPKVVHRETSKEQADADVKTLSIGNAKAEVWVVPTGPDLARGWGKRRTVAEDYLFDAPVMLGSRRIGPDLANVGEREPDEKWQLRHLYAPQVVVKGSAMPPFRFLFETRKIMRAPSPEALGPDLAPAPGYEVVPLPAAKALAAYLASLRTDVPLFDAPLYVPPPPTPTGTNQPNAAGLEATNSAPANSPPIQPSAK